MYKKFKDLLKYNLTDVLFMVALTFLFLSSETIGVVLMLQLMSTMGFLGFIFSLTGMLFIVFMYLFMMVSILENLD